MRRHPRLPRAAQIAALALVACLAPPTTASAEISFVAPVSFPVPDAEDAVAGDFNGDSLPDVAVANTQQASVSVLLGDGMAGLGPASTLPVAGHPRDVEAADFNGDGFLDLAVTGQETGKVTIFPGVGNGTFGPSFDVSAAVNSVRLAAADLNGDGKVDLVVSDAGSSPPHVNVLLGDGTGGFAAPVSYDAFGGVAPSDLVLADLKRDGSPDIITAGAGTNTWSAYVNDGAGKFNTQLSRSLGGEATAVTAGDFNGDGNTDVGVGIANQGVTVLLGDGQNSVSARVTYATPSAFPLSLAAADLDRDGNADIAATGGGLSTLRGLGDGTFAAAGDHAGGGVALTVTDLDGDAMPDLVVSRNQALIVLGNNSTPPLPAPVVARTANVAPVKGSVLVKQPGKRHFVRLEDDAHIAIGSELDVTKGAVRLTSAAGGGRTQSGVFRGGLFKLGQKKGKRPITELKLTAKLRCLKARRPVQTSAKRRRSRQLFGNAHGRFRTRGRHSTATVRGTKWLVKDTCRSTLTVSQRGTVVVRDLVKHRTVTLKSGQRYLARRGNR